MLANKDIRTAIKNTGLHQWQVADRLSISENTMSRKLRKELPEEEKKRIYDAIRDEAAEQRA